MLNYDVCAIVNDNCEKKLVEREEKAEQKKMIVLSILLGIVTILIAITLFLICNMDTEAKAKPKECVRVEKQIKYKYGKKTRIYDSSKLSYRTLTTRKNKSIIVERVYGKVTTGKNGRDSNGYYISYKGVRGIHKGSRIVSYFVYNPKNNYSDDIIKRYDVVVK